MVDHPSHPHNPVPPGGAGQPPQHHAHPHSPSDKISGEVKELIQKAEDMRLKNSHSYKFRQSLFYFVMSLSVGGSACYFVWVFLMGGSFALALGALGAGIVITPLMGYWAKMPLNNYRKTFKSEFMPALAKALGNLHYHPTGGIGMKTMIPSGIIPPHATYGAEDSFRGTFRKNIGLIVSEARMYGKNAKAPPIFDGLLVYLSVPKGSFKGHTIITSDHNAVKRWANTRWKKFNQIPVQQGIEAGDFRVFTTNDDEGRGLADQDFIELLHKLSHLFGNKPVSSAFYGGSRVLLMIPSDDDMFEPGEIEIPVTSHGYAMKCKREIEQILNIVDVLDVYEADSSPLPAQQHQPPPVQEQPVQPPPAVPVIETPPEAVPSEPPNIPSNTAPEVQPEQPMPETIQPQQTPTVPPVVPEPAESGPLKIEEDKADENQPEKPSESGS